MEKTDKIEEAANHYASVTDPEAHGIDFIREVFIAGAECDREQMLKDAVEGEVYKFGEVAYVKERNNAELTKYLSQFNNGDRVKIIVIHETDIR